MHKNPSSSGGNELGARVASPAPGGLSSGPGLAYTPSLTPGSLSLLLQKLLLEQSHPASRHGSLCSCDLECSYLAPRVQSRVTLPESNPSSAPHELCDLVRLLRLSVPQSPRLQGVDDNNPSRGRSRAQGSPSPSLTACVTWGQPPLLSNPSA